MISAPAASFAWTPLQEGTYSVRASVKGGYAATTAKDAMATFVITARARGQRAVISSTANPLVALYSAPACTTGTMTVMFQPASGGTWQSMLSGACSKGHTINVYVAGMRAKTRYILRDVVSDGKHSTTSPSLFSHVDDVRTFAELGLPLSDPAAGSGARTAA